ncbi:transposase, IS4 family [Leptospira alexanderi serovar Manhao 3 str. L 60]|uniref:Transposase, IS4 family n=5 Tax=Leptospira TaxID=171 RepID=V6HY56_9LEPT|nr:transposase, IS4 family [Leptospira alexanderi serovar Manhao 3 str. L 60]
MHRGKAKIKPEIISLDKAYCGKPVQILLSKMRINSRIPNKTNAKNPKRLSKLKPFRWIVERTFAWLNAFRAVKTCWEFKEKNYFAFCILACSIILFRMAKR